VKMTYEMKVHLSAMLPTRIVVDAAQNTQYQRKRAFPYGTDETSLRAKSALPMKPDGGNVRKWMSGHIR